MLFKQQQILHLKENLILEILEKPLQWVQRNTLMEAKDHCMKLQNTVTEFGDNMIITNYYFGASQWPSLRC